MAIKCEPGKTVRVAVQRRGDDFIDPQRREQGDAGRGDILRQSVRFGIGSPRASIESNFALRELVGAENFYVPVSMRGEQERKLALKVLREGGLTPALVWEIESMTRYWSWVRMSLQDRRARCAGGTSGGER